MQTIQELTDKLTNKGYKVRAKDKKSTTTDGKDALTTLQVDQDIFPLFEMIVTGASQHDRAPHHGSSAKAPNVPGLIEDLPAAEDFSVMSFARIALSHKVPLYPHNPGKRQDAYFLKIEV